MRLMVRGGDDFADHELFAWRLGQVDQQYPIACVITGSQPGADAMARGWAQHYGRELLVFTPDWGGQLGARAGTECNSRMLLQGKPDLLLVFPGGPNTLNAAGHARMLRITCWEGKRT